MSNHALHWTYASDMYSQYLILFFRYKYLILDT